MRNDTLKWSFAIGTGGEKVLRCWVLSLNLWLSGDEYKAGPLAEYERRIAAGELKSGDEYQVCFAAFNSAHVV